MPVIQVDSVSQASSFRKSPESDFASSSSSSSRCSVSSLKSASVISIEGLEVVKEIGLSEQDKSFNEMKRSDSLGDINLRITPQ